MEASRHNLFGRDAQAGGSRMRGGRRPRRSYCERGTEARPTARMLATYGACVAAMIR